MHSQEILIKLEKVGYAIAAESGVKKLLSDISLSVAKKTVTTIIGPNGAGKTTLIKLVLGLVKPTSGTILKNNITIGYVPQKVMANRYMPMTVAAYLKINSVKNLNYPFNIDSLMDTSIHALSGGELQKVLLNVAVAGNPDLLILDEPTQGIDANGIANFHKMLRMVKKERKLAILLVSHDLHFVFDYTDYVICLNQHICCHGHPETVKNTSDVQKLFPGFAPYHHHHDHEH